MAYKAGGVAEVLENYEFAKLIEAGNKHAYTQAVLDFANSLNKSKNLSNQSFEIFSLNQLIQGHIDLYSKLLK